MCVVEWSLVADVLGSLAGLITAIVAAYALFMAYPNWKKRQDELRKSERAEQILASFYECEMTISWIRSELLRGREVPEAKNALNEQKVSFNERGHSPEVTAQVIINRLNEAQPKWQKLCDLIPFASINFHGKVRKAMEDALLVRNELVIAAQFFVDADGDYQKKVRRTIFGGPKGEEDEISRRLITIEADLLEHLRKYVAAE